jgi:two-component system NtrC family sensor kinase
LAAGVAHEINNPLTGVLTYSSYLLKRADGQPEIKDDLEVIVRETKRCRDIVKGLLDFARQSPPEKRPASVNEIIAQAIRIMHNQLATHHIKIEQSLHRSLPVINADATQIQQVLVNLLINANDAMPETGGVISIATTSSKGAAVGLAGLSPDKEYVQINVSDTGCGISPENLRKIFEPFFSTKGKKGYGLGLAVVWGIIEKHNGKITVESEVGRGTTFRIFLPTE